MKLYVGNLNYSISENELANIFGNYGEVISVKLIIDRETGKPKGFGFIEMADENAAKQAIQELEGSDLKGRTMRVNEANPPKPRVN